MDRGEANWQRARDFWKRCGRLPIEDAEIVADSLFGLDPATAAPERLDPQDRLKDRPWHVADFVAALEREAVRAEGHDVIAERERRRKAYQERSAEIVVSDNGTAIFSVTGALVSLCAAHARVDRAARLLRKQGDPRTLAQLRSDVVSALLLHGQLPNCGSAEQGANPDDELAVPDLGALFRVVNGLPAIALQVVIPWNALAGHHDASEPVGSEADQHDVGSNHDDRGERDVGLILGHHPAYITPGQARELALLPGTTLHRMLTDPVDGRLIERSSQSYRPDGVMRTQVMAADVFSRAPGSRQAAINCELDHVSPWGTDDGVTSETNLVTLSKASHQAKTLGMAISTINERRDLTWTTLLGQVETTRVHDYRQYSSAGRATSTRTLGPKELRQALDNLAPLKPTPPDQTLSESQGRNLDHPSQRRDLDDRRDLVARALYAALAERGPDGLLLGDDDYPGSGEHGGDLAGWMFVTCTTPAGARRYGAAADSPSLADVLHIVKPEDPTAVNPDGDATRGGKATPWESPTDEPPPF